MVLKDLQIIMNNSISHYQICIWKLAFHGNRIILALVCSFSEHAVLDTVLGNTKRTRRLSLTVQAWPGLTCTETEVKRNETWWWCLTVWSHIMVLSPWNSLESADVDGRIFSPVTGWVVFLHLHVYVAG